MEMYFSGEVGGVPINQASISAPRDGFLRCQITWSSECQVRVTAVSRSSLHCCTPAARCTEVGLFRIVERGGTWDIVLF